jgi:CheY-like chemotaxis protein
MNLVMNASEAIGPGNGTILLSTGLANCDAEYAKTLLPAAVAPGSYVFVEVSDTGCGMDKATQQRIFEPFFTTKFAGRGLGLAAVLGIVRGHRGGVKVYSEVGHGTSLKVFFPATEGVAAPVAASGPAAPEWKGSGTVLVVDDEETVLATATKILQRAGFRVLGARDGDDAVVLFRAHAKEIACILLDLTMPRMNGEAAFRELRGIREDVPIVLTSGYNKQDAIQHFAGRRLTAFIQKPYTTAGLLSCLKEVLASRTTGVGDGQA